MRNITVIFILLSALLCRSQPQEIQLSSLPWTFRKASDSLAYPAKIPGTVHTDLLNNALIEDPFFGTNEKDLQWIENETWIYETGVTFTDNELKRKKARIVFGGLDTYARVYINDSEVLRASNMFRIWEKEVAEFLKPGNNTIKVVFEPAAVIAKEQAAQLSYALPGGERVFVRKPQYQFGWDWGPRFVTCGIWKEAQILLYNDPYITDVHSQVLTLNDTLAEIGLRITLSHPAQEDMILQAFVGDTLQQLQKNVKINTGESSCQLTVMVWNPRRWWCRGLGDAHVYKVLVQLRSGTNVISEKQQSIGLRTLELVQEQDAQGQSFYFRLNGMPVFAKGANYIPQDNFIPRVSDGRYRTLLQRAADANMNMLRVWGGGIYEKEIFYDLCDSLGIMVWQDFMFACAMYPGDSTFINNVKEEVRQQVIRLRNHPCLALWCGNNENDEGWKNWGWQKEFGYTAADSAAIYNDYRNLFLKEIPGIITRYDSSRNYHSSSPATGWGRPEAYTGGDVHYWGVWWGMEPFENYREKTGRFVSEYGFQSMPSAALLRKYLPENAFSLQSDAMKNHQKHPTGFETIRKYMVRDYKVPGSTEKFIYISQLLQARGMENAIEAHRKNRPLCMGTLFWQLNDCWPVVSWSCLDYEQSPKAFYYSAKNGFFNIILVNEMRGDKVLSYLVSDAMEDVSVILTVELMDFLGNTFYRNTVYHKASYNTSRQIFSFPLSQLDENSIPATATLIRYTLILNGTETRQQYFYFEKPKNLSLLDPGLRTEKAGMNKVKVTATKYLAKNVYLYSDNLVFEDNFFDLMPGQSRTVSYKSNLPSANASPVISVMSLYDTMK